MLYAGEYDLTADLLEKKHELAMDPDAIAHADAATPPRLIKAVPRRV